VRRKVHQPTRAGAAVAFGLYTIQACCCPDQCGGLGACLLRAQPRSMSPRAHVTPFADGQKERAM
jgi:hypothetical protein